MAGDHAIGRSRGGPTTKIHLACDGHGRPLPVVLTGGNVNDCTMFTQVMAASRSVDQVLAVQRPGRAGYWRTRATPAAPSAAALRRRHIPATIPERRDQRANRLRRGRAGGHPPASDRTAYKHRNIAERCLTTPRRM